MYLGEKSAPDWLDIRDLGGGDESLELLGLYRAEKSVYQFLPDLQRVGSRSNTYGDLDTVIGQDEGGVGGSELGGRHCDVFCVVVVEQSSLIEMPFSFLRG